MDNNKLPSNGEPQMSDLRKKWENYWYHYKIQTLIGLVAVVTLIICSVQFFTREVHDYRLMYAGPQIVALQDIVYMEKAVEEIADDYDGNGEVAVAFDDIVMLSPEEREAAMEAGAVFNAEFLNTSMTEYYQQIVGGDAVICLLSPYMYEIVHESDGFLLLCEIFDEIPDSAYDDCGIVLSRTDFGRYFNGINDLPENTVLCIRRLSTMAKFKGEEKTKKAHAASIELFRRMVEFDAPESADTSDEQDTAAPAAISSAIDHQAKFVRAGSAVDIAEIISRHSENASSLAISSVQHILLSHVANADEMSALRSDIAEYYSNKWGKDESTFTEAVQEYDAEFFDDNALFILALCEPSGSIQHEVEFVRVIKGESVSVGVERVTDAKTNDVAFWYGIVEVKKSDLEEVAEFDAWYLN